MSKEKMEKKENKMKLNETYVRKSYLLILMIHAYGAFYRNLHYTDIIRLYSVVFDFNITFFFFTSYQLVQYISYHVIISLHSTISNTFRRMHQT